MNTEAQEENAVGRKVLLVLLLVVVLILGVGLYTYFRHSPSLGNSEAVRQTVDALFTAFTSKNLDRLKDCENRLITFRETGELPQPAYRSLAEMIQQARDGGWETAARSLYDFIQRQQSWNHSGEVAMPVRAEKKTKR